MRKEDAVALWKFQSQLMWSRTQTAAIIEAGTLAGWYKLFEEKHLLIAQFLLGFGAIIIIGILILMKRDSQFLDRIRDENEQEIPRPSDPIFGLAGRRVAFILLYFIAICNLILILFTGC